MIVEYSYSQRDLRNKCYGCMYLSIRDNELIGECTCLYNSIKNRQRDIMQRACSWKNADQIKMDI